MSMQEVRDAIPQLKDEVVKHKIQISKAEFNNANLGAAIMATKTTDGKLDLRAALVYLAEKHGGGEDLLKEQAEAAGEMPEDPAEAKKRKRNEQARERNKKKREAELAALPNLNNALSEFLEELGSLAFKDTSNDKAKFKGIALKKAAKALQEHTEVIKSGKQAMDLKGVGKGTAEKIDEFLTTGKCQELEDYRAQFGAVSKDDL